MHRFFVPQLYNEEMYIEGVDARHISKVLRMQPGAQLQIVSDDGVSAVAEITLLSLSSINSMLGLMSTVILPVAVGSFEQEVNMYRQPASMQTDKIIPKILFILIASLLLCLNYTTHILTHY